MGEGSEVARLVVFFETGEPEPRPLVSHVHFDHEKAFVVAKADVVARAEFLDEAAFEEQRFGLAAGEVPLKIPDRVEQGAGLDVGAHSAARHEILAHAFAEIARFAHVDHAVETVAHEIDARLVRDIAEFDFRIGFLGCGHAGAESIADWRVRSTAKARAGGGKGRMTNGE